MSSIYFTKDHEWIAVANGEGVVGITDHAQHALGDLVFVELPELGRRVAQGGEIAVVESVKAASDVYSPVSGEVVAVNQAAADQPGLINEQPESDGWLYRLRLANAAELEGLMDRAAYDAFVQGLE
ncbi:glycine cleavage system H protein [mine drainage metagenome]|uniref:Glycine cleavage system H protein n=1 Tax=mine drainage metagenome TaxID=410659 RepID=A0A1J5SV95_9ZZZZ